MTPPNAETIASSSFFRDVWRLGMIYWRSPAAQVGAALLALAIALELATVYSAVLVARTQATVFDVIQDRNVAAFLGALGMQAAAMLTTIFAATFRIYVRQVLEIRWRRKMTAEYLRRWMTPEAYVARFLESGMLRGRGVPEDAVVLATEVARVVRAAAAAR